MKQKKFWISLIAAILALILLLGLVISLLPQSASAAQSSSEIKEQINQLKQEQKDTQAKIDELEEKRSDNLDDIRSVVEQKSIIEEQMGMLYSQIQLMNEQVAAYNLLIADMQEDLDEAEDRLQELTAKNKERIRAMEEDGEISYWSVLFEANSFTDLLDRLNMVQEIAEADNRRLEEMREAAQEVSDAQAALQTEREELNTAKDELSAMQTELTAKSEESQVLLNELAARSEEYEALMVELENDLDEVEDSIAQAKLDYDAAKYREYLATMTTAPKATSSSSSGSVTGGSEAVDESGIVWLVPCSYIKVSSGFGYRTHPITGEWKLHKGVDLAANCKMHSDGTTDSPIYATRSGVVVVSTYNKSGGWMVTIDHLDGYRSTYMHMCTKPFVKVGEAVAAGQTIGCIGSTGQSTGDHLHFGIFKYNSSTGQYEPVNPMNYISLK